MFYKISKCVSRLNFTSAASWCVTLYEFFILVLHHSPKAFLYSTSDLYCLNSGESILGEFLLYFTNLLFLQSLLTWVGAVVLSTLFSLLRKFLPQSPMESGKSNNHPNFSQPGKIVDTMMTILMAMMATQHCMSRFLRVDDSGKHHMPTWSRLDSKEPFI